MRAHTLPEGDIAVPDPRYNFLHNSLAQELFAIRYSSDLEATQAGERCGWISFLVIIDRLLSRGIYSNTR